MARLLFGGSSDDYAVDSSGRPITGRRVRFYTSAAMTTEITDLASDAAGTGTPLTVNTDAHGFWGPVYGPDAVTVMYAGTVDAAGNAPAYVVAVYTHTTTAGGVTSFNTRTGAITLAKADVTGTALAAADVGAAAVGATAKPRGAWVTATVYAVNDVITSGGAAYRCITAHTSGASFSGAGANWEAWGSAASLGVKDEGTTVVATASALNFVGAGVTASDGGSGVATVTIPGGGGSSTFPVTTIAASGTAQTLTVPAHAEAGYDITLTGNCTLTISGGTASEECILVLYLKQDATGSRAVAWPGSVKWPNNVVPTLSTAAGAVDIILLRTKDASTTLYGSVLASAGITSTILAAKGDLITATGAGAATNLPVGANGQTIVADSAQAAGIKWATAAAVSGIRPLLASTWYIPAGSIGGVGNKALSGTAGTPWAIPIWLPSVTLTGLACYIATASTYATFDARLGIYDGSTGIPGSLVVDAGTFSCLTTGAKTLTISTPVTAGLYWLVIAGQNLSTPGAAPQFKAISSLSTEISIGTSASNLQFGGGAAYNGGTMTGALPATFPYVTGAFDSAAPMIAVKA